MKNSTYPKFVSEHLSRLRALRAHFLVLAAGLEKLETGDFQRARGVATDSSSEAASGLDQAQQADPKKMSERFLAILALSRIRALNAAFLRNAAALVDRVKSSSAKGPAGSGIRKAADSFKRSSKPSDAYGNLARVLKLEPRHARALATLEQMELALSGRPAGSGQGGKASAEGKFFLYRLDAKPSSAPKAVVVPVSPESRAGAEADTARIKIFFDTAIVCGMHIAGRFQKPGG
jgi:hypothetical protein